MPIPEPHLGGLIVGTVLDLFAAWSLFDTRWMGLAVGAPPLVAGVSLACWSVIAAQDVDMAEPSRIPVRGPFAFSRNPMYVAWDLAYVGVALAVNTAWPLVALPVVLALIHLQILREERRLDELFGVEYRNYKSMVRRYL